jgi:hypothetical protein
MVFSLICLPSLIKISNECLPYGMSPLDLLVYVHFGRRRRISSPVCACMPHSIAYIIMMGRGMTLVTVTELISTSFENFSFRMHVCMNETKWKVFWESISSVSFYGLGGLEEYSLLAAMP